MHKEVNKRIRPMQINKFSPSIPDNYNIELITQSLCDCIEMFHKKGDLISCIKNVMINCLNRIEIIFIS